jgi:superfamily II DNA helicase RecQ
MDAHDKDLLIKIGNMVEDCQRRLTLLEELVRSGGSRRVGDAPDKEAKRAEKQAAVEALSASDRALYDALREWRAEKARSLGWSPMTVAHDKTLLAITALRPSTELAMGAVNANLARKYGPELLAIVKKHSQAAGDGDW